MRFLQKRIAFVVWLALATTALIAQQPASSTAPAGKGAIVGTVVDSVTNAPIPNATVNVSADGNRTRTSVIADDRGRFVFNDAPAGRLFLTSNHPGYVTGYYGVRSPFAANQFFDLTDGETATGVVMRMWKNAVVTGMVTDANQEPVVGASVMAARVEVVGGRQMIGAGRQAKTDDRGMYRLADVVPAEYAMVLISPANGPATSKTYSAAGYPTVFYPDSTSSAGASILTLRPGEERAGLDFHVTRQPSFAVSGVVTGTTEGRSRPLQLSLTPADPTRFPTTLDVRTATADAQGQFTFPGVASGTYVIEVVDMPVEPATPGTATMMFSQLGNGFGILGGGPGLPAGTARPLASSPSAPTLWANVPVAVEDRNVQDVAIVLRAGARVRGRVVFDGNSDKPTEQELSATPVVPMSADGRQMGFLPASGISADGSFQTVGVPAGQYRLFILWNSPPWTQATVSVDGQQMPGQSFTLGSADLNLVITFVDRPAALSGTVRDESGKAASDATIYAFSTDRRAWTDTSFGGAIEARPARDGTYEGRLAPGEYFVAAVEITTREDWRRIDVLEVLARTAKTVKVAVGQKATLDLVVPKGN